MTDNQIVINNLSKVYDNGFNALKNINLSLKKGEFLGIIGESGSGKTTLIDIILGLLKPHNHKEQLKLNSKPLWTQICLQNRR